MELIYDGKENAPSYAKSITTKNCSKVGTNNRANRANRGENNKAVYTANVARIGGQNAKALHTYRPTDRPTDGHTRFIATKNDMNGNTQVGFICTGF